MRSSGICFAHLSLKLNDSHIARCIGSSCCLRKTLNFDLVEVLSLDTEIHRLESADARRFRDEDRFGRIPE